VLYCLDPVPAVVKEKPELDFATPGLYPVEVRLSFGPSLVTDHLQAIVTVLSLVNPFMCAGIFAQIEAGKSLDAKMGSAAKVALAVLVILTVAALVG
jgi:hypothetical protein